MYLVAMEVLNDVLRMNILPALFRRQPLDHPDVNLTPDLLDKVSTVPRFERRSLRRRSW